MKCSRCGEECKDNQAFCLKCGTPIQVVPDFNLIEAELANNVGELMQENNEEKKVTRKTISRFEDTDFLNDEHYVDTMPEHEVEAEISLIDIENLKDTAKINDYQVDGTDFNQDESQETELEQNDMHQSEKKVFKVKAIVFGVIAVIIIAIAILLLTILDKGSSSKDSFTNVYNKAYDSYTAKDYKDALDKFLEASKLADTNNEKIKVNKSLLATYENLDGTEDKQVEVLKKLIDLEPNKYEYYEKLVEIYDAKNMTDEISSLIDSIDDVSIKSKLADYTVSTPKFSEEAGEYDTYISIKLISADNDIYYTLDGTEPSASSQKYSDEIKLNKDGEITVKAIAINDKGISSKVASAKYVINPKVIDAPEVTPDGGVFNQNSEITVTVPEGMKCYYTYGSTAIVPTTSDTEYTEPVKMHRGKNIFSAILVLESGVVSEVTQNIYQLNLSSSITYDDALVILKNYLETNSIATKVTDDEFVKTDGNTITFTYNSIANVDNGEYYVINAIEKDSSDKTVNVVYYGVDTVTSSLVILVEDTENAGKYKLTE